MKLLVSIMSVCSKYENNDFRIVNFLNKPMFLGDTSASFTRSIARKGLGLSGASARMLLQFRNQLQCLMICFWLIVKKLSKVDLSLFPDFYCIALHRLLMYWSSSSTLANSIAGPFFASSTRAKNSSFVKRVASSFSATSLRKYLAARFKFQVKGQGSPSNR